MNKKLWILLISYSLIQLAGAMIGPIYALFVEKIGGDLLDASFAAATYGIATGIAMLFFGKVQDKLKNKRLLMVLGFLIVGVTYFYYMFVKDVWGLLFAQIIIGIGSAMYTPAHDMLYARYLDKGMDGREWGAWEASYNLSVAVGAIIGGFVVVNFSFTTLFGLMGLLCVAVSQFLWYLPKDEL